MYLMNIYIPFETYKLQEDQVIFELFFLLSPFFSSDFFYISLSLLQHLNVSKIIKSCYIRDIGTPPPIKTQVRLLLNSQLINLLLWTLKKLLQKFYNRFSKGKNIVQSIIIKYPSKSHYMAPGQHGFLINSTISFWITLAFKLTQLVILISFESKSCLRRFLDMLKLFLYEIPKL